MGILFFAYGLLATTAAVVVTTVVAVSAAANEDEDYYKNPTAAVTTETIITHIKDLLFVFITYYADVNICVTYYLRN